jgi:threonine/homoserine/homoserine lactone efflux protein
MGVDAVIPLSGASPLAGLTFVPDAPTMAAYTVACLILCITPGPDMSLFLQRTITAGRTAGIASTLGASAGCLVHTVLAAVGLSALIATSPTAFLVLKVVGAVYLGWLAVDAIRNGSSLNVRDEARQTISVSRAFWTGVVINLSNPKVVLFFVTFLPQFVSSADPHAAGKLAFLGVFMVVFSTPITILMILGADRVVGALKARPRIMRGIDYVFATVFGAFAAKILLTEGR